MQDCSSINDDFSKVVKMAEVFASPLSLIYTVGKNLYLNGIDIFEKIMNAMVAYEEGDYFSFGMYLGQAMDEVFLKAPYSKKESDVKAYDFFSGFYSLIPATSPLDKMHLYNNIDDFGDTIMSPLAMSIE